MSPDNSALAIYLRQIGSVPLLTEKEEKLLTRAYARTRDPAVAQRLAQGHLRLVVSIAKKHCHRPEALLDLIQEGNLGLMRAIERFEPERGLRLVTYAGYWIRAYILHAVLQNWRLVKIGTTGPQRRIFFQLDRERTRLQKLGVEPTRERLARRLGVGENQLACLIEHLSSAETSLASPAGNGRVVEDLLRAPDEERPDRRTEDAELAALTRARLNRFRSSISDRDNVIVEKRWVAPRKSTLDRLGKQLGISRERVRQLEQRLLLRFRSFFGTELAAAG